MAGCTWSMTPEEALRRERARQAYIKELRRVQRVCRGLNASIRKSIEEKTPESHKRVAHWQKIACRHYGIPHGEWLASQREN